MLNWSGLEIEDMDLLDLDLGPTACEVSLINQQCTSNGGLANVQFEYDGLVLFGEHDLPESMTYKGTFGPGMHLIYARNYERYLKSGVFSRFDRL